MKLTISISLFFAGLDALAYDPHKFAMDYHTIGFRECASEVARYMVTVEGMNTQDPLRLRLMSHLQCFVAQRELANKQASASSWGLNPLTPNPSYTLPSHHHLHHLNSTNTGRKGRGISNFQDGRQALSTCKLSLAFPDIFKIAAVYFQHCIFKRTAVYFQLCLFKIASTNSQYFQKDGRVFPPCIFAMAAVYFRHVFSKWRRLCIVCVACISGIAFFKWRVRTIRIFKMAVTGHAFKHPKHF
jgi:hypothetical protein